MSVSSLSGKGTEVTICLPLQGNSPFNRKQIKEADSEDRQSPFEPAEKCLETLRKVAHGKRIGLHQREISKYNRTSGENMVLDCIDVYLTQWYDIRVTTFSNWNEAPEVDLIIAIEDEQHDIINWSDPSAPGKLAPVLLVTDRYFGTGSRQLPNGIFGYYTRPVGPHKLAKCLLACFEKLEGSNIGSNSTHEETITKDGFDVNSRQVGASGAPAKQQGASSSDEGSGSEIGNLGERPSPAAQSTLPIRVLPRQVSYSTADTSRDDAPVTSDMRPTPIDPPTQTNTPSKPLVTPKISDFGPIQSRPLQILVVEDNEINLQLLHRFLSKRKGDRIAAARNGYEAVAAVQNTPDPYDVIFMDISMPGIDGFEATRQIRRYEGQSGARLQELTESPPRASAQLGQRGNQQAYIVALTGLGAGRDRDEAFKSGCNEFLTKPIPFQKVGRMLDERSRHLGRALDV